MRADRFSMKELAKAEAEEQRQGANNPMYHWVDDLQGFIDTDEEHDPNDDLIKMGEGDSIAGDMGIFPGL